MPLKLNFKIVATFFFALFFTFIPVIVSGDFRWVEGWTLAIVSIVFSLLSRVLAAHKNPDIIQERAGFTDSQGIKPWDKKIVPLLAFIVPLLIYTIFGLDRRFGWSMPVPVLVRVVGLFVFLSGFFLSTWAMVENRFFSSVVRIQTERGHTVCDTGPYRWVRHPGYLGGLIGWVGIPIFLGSLWGYFPVLIEMALYVIRTRLEDQTLQAELPGYKEYTQHTRYRLLPGIW
jgi:protein-S-isoprenylcysteine O-methyltransferase Ste14